MEFSDEQKNIIIQSSETSIVELDRLQTKIATRNNEFVEAQGNQPSLMETDLTKLSNEELQTLIITLSKLQCEFTNIRSQLIFRIQKADTEIMKRQ